MTGKAVLVFRHDPEEANPASRFSKDPTAPTTFSSKARNARAHGAKAILFVTDPNNHPNESDTVGKATEDLEFRDLSILSMHVTRDAVASLFAQAGKSMAGYPEIHRFRTQASVLRIYRIQDTRDDRCHADS